MNPFKHSETLSSLTISSTNIRSLGITTKGIPRKKISAILDLKSDLNILIDCKTSRDEFNKILNENSLKYKLGRYRHMGTNTANKGIIIMYNKDRISIKNFEVVIDK